MRIGVNTRLLIKGRLEGIGYFEQQLLKRLCVSHPNDTFIFFFDRKYDREFVFADNVIPVVLPLQSRHPVLWKIYFDFLLPVYCKQYKIDVFFSPENYIPHLKHIPIICTVHDLNFFHNDKYIGSNAHQRYFMHYFPMFAKKSDKVVTVSNFSKQDICESFSLPQDKVEVVYNAANNVYKPYDEKTNSLTRLKYASGNEYFYFVGAIHKRKNLTNIFLAFDRFKHLSRSDVKLIVIGNKKWRQGEMEDTYNNMQYRKDVIFTGRLEAKEVSLVASASLGLVFPSLFEGFGIPVVEAFACGTPVITSNVTSLPEVAGGAALTVNPYDVNAIADAMLSIYMNEDLRHTLSEKGLQRSKDFNWNDSADKLWNIITSVMN
ncbi:MAG: glycosyltransferase family 4 protein [Bacteroidales bacterium]|nr:glycosyltransferase family 4 protein [Bacteroidales bacterium]